jgi:hypothetical protein
MNCGTISSDGTYTPATNDYEQWQGMVKAILHDYPYHNGSDLILNAPVPLTGQVITSEEDITPNSVNQGNAGDCWFMAVLAAMAAIPAGKDKLYQNMKWDGTKHCYIVTLYYKGKAETYDVDTVYGDGGHVKTWGEPSWTSVYEDALIQYAQVHHGGNGVQWINSGSGSDAMPILTGQPANKVGTDTKIIKDALSQGELVTVASPPKGKDIILSDGDVVVVDHEYTVVHVYDDGSVMLRNPWGDKNTIGSAYLTLTNEGFYAYFKEMNLGSV